MAGRRRGQPPPYVAGPGKSDPRRFSEATNLCSHSPIKAGGVSQVVDATTNPTMVRALAVLVDDLDQIPAGVIVVTFPIHAGSCV